MKVRNITRFLDAIMKWCDGEAGVHDIADLIGCPTALLSDMLFQNGLSDGRFSPTPEATPTRVFNTIVVWLAMRKSF